MCLIIARPENSSIDWTAADDAARFNPDGYGLAFPKGGTLAVNKSMVWLNIKAKAKRLEMQNVPFILHQRFATHGAINLANAHPFRLVNHGLVMAHNGIIGSLPVPAGMSDTRVLVRRLDRIAPKAMMAEAEMLAGNSRLAFIDADGQITFVNEHLGAWGSDGAWYSQRSATRRAASQSSINAFNPSLW